MTSIRNHLNYLFFQKQKSIF